jgi:hypothetical protein
MHDFWDELGHKIANPQDRVLFDEAKDAARAGALRAAYIAVWLSCAESLKRKFADVAQTDHDAAKVVGHISDKEGRKQSIDAFVLEKATKYGFVSDAESMQLVNVYDQRCIYGHPYEQAPISAQLEAAAAIVVEYVLSRPTKLRHGYLERQVKLLCKNPTYLDDHRPAVEGCAQVVHQRSSSDLHLWFLKKLWQEFASSANDPAMAAFSRRTRWFTIAFLRQCEAAFFSSWDAVDALTRYPFLSRSLVDLSLFIRLSDHARDIVVGELLAAARPSDAKAVHDLHNNGILSERQVQRMQAGLQLIPVHSLAAAGFVARDIFDRTIQQIRTRNWYVQQPGIDALRAFGPDGIATLDAVQQTCAGNNVLQAAEGGSIAAASFLSDLSHGHTLWPLAFIEGILAECVVNDDNRYRFKASRAALAMLCIRSVEPASRAGVVERLVARLRSATPKHEALDPSDHALVIAAVDAAMAADSEACGCLQPFRDALAGLEVQQDDN